jgi:hypothetical protein
VLTLVWSEFGRRAEENGSNGTDHGAAGIGLLMGTRVRGTMIGEFPGLQNGLDDDGNLKATVDYRTVYSSVLEQWLRRTRGASSRSRSRSDGCRSCDEAPRPPARPRRLRRRAPREAAAPLGRVQVVAVEFHYRLSRVSVPAGPGPDRARQLRPGRAQPALREGRDDEGLRHARARSRPRAKTHAAA